MNVRELIQYLDTFDPNLPVAYSCFSEQCMMEPSEIEVAMLCEARSDGWIANSRPDKHSIPYLLFPGN